MKISRLTDLELSKILSGVVDGVSPTSQEISMASELQEWRALYSWIPIEDRLPGDSYHYLPLNLLLNGRTPVQGGWQDGVFWLEGVEIKNVTHWMPLPAAPHFRGIGNSSTNNCRENSETSTKCWCHTCRPVTISDMRFVVCPECGNKRCPHANDHNNACTGSNEPGQAGSEYPAAPRKEVK